MTSETERTEFKQDLSQLVHHYQAEGVDKDMIADQLRLQAEVVALTSDD